MNMPCIKKTAYYQHVETILDALEVEAEIDMKKVAFFMCTPASKYPQKFFLLLLER